MTKTLVGELRMKQPEKASPVMSSRSRTGQRCQGYSQSGSVAVVAVADAEAALPMPAVSSPSHSNALQFEQFS